MTSPEEKQKKLAGSLSALPSCLIAFSGGLDSVFLAFMAKAHVPGRVLCVTLTDASTPRRDLESAGKTAASYGHEHIVIEREIPPLVRRNARDRCYHCKTRLFQELEKIKTTEGLAAVLDGENASDAADDRPGSRAARELGVISPLADAGMTKDDIRFLAKQHGISEWCRPASACLSTRIPYGTGIDDANLEMVDKTEEFIRSKGIRMIRARVEGKGIRLELGQEENTAENGAILKALGPEIKGFGWQSVEIDPNGYVPAGLRKKNDRQ